MNDKFKFMIPVETNVKDSLSTKQKYIEYIILNKYYNDIEI